MIGPRATWLTLGIFFHLNSRNSFEHEGEMEVCDFLNDSALKSGLLAAQVQISGSPLEGAGGERSQSPLSRLPGPSHLPL